MDLSSVGGSVMAVCVVVFVTLHGRGRKTISNKNR